MLIGAALALIAGSCTDKYMEYDQNLAALGFVYTNASDSTVYSFVLHPGTTEGEIEVPFRLMGYPMPTDRTVGVEVDQAHSTAVEGKDFAIEPSILQADSVYGIIKVKVMKTAELDQKDLTATIKLKANESFAEPPVNEARYRILITNQLTKPDQWPFNEYSRVKHEFVIQVTGIGTGYGNWNGQQLVYWTGVLINALYEYNNSHPGNPLKDENGRLVTF